MKLVCACPPAGMIDVAGTKWGLCVLTLLGQFGPMRYRDFHRALPNVGPATLSATLRALERSGLIDHQTPDGTLYQLTPPGDSLYLAIRPWSGRYPPLA